MNDLPPGMLHQKRKQMTNIKSLRTKMGATQQQLASMLGITRGAFANIENGMREPDIATIIKLADFFGVSTDYLLNYKIGKESVNLPRSFVALEEEEQSAVHRMFSDYLRLDPRDQGQIYGEIKFLLQSEKYSTQERLKKRLGKLLTVHFTDE